MSAERAWTTLFYRNGHLLGATLGVVAVAGVLAWIGLPQLEDPRIVNRDPLALTPVPGASAERVEALVTEVLEDALAEIEQISSLESTSRDGLSVVRMKLAADLDDDAARKAVSEIRDALAGAAADLPPEALPTEVDYERDPAAFTLIVALHADDGHAVSLGVLGRLAEDLADRLREVEGTELVRIYGEAAEEIVVTADADRLAELGLPTGSVAAALAAADVKRPAGLLRGSADLALEVRGAFDDVARVAAVPVGDGAAALTRVGDVASVTRGVRTPASDRVRIDGRTAVLVAARMESGQIARWSERAGAVVAAMQRGAGTGIVFRPVFEQERYTTARLRELGGNLLAGAGVVLLVVLVAMGWRLALVIGSALPLVVAAVLFGLLASGEALHQMSIFGLIIALGLLIDNAIVVADDVAQRRSAGARPLAAVDGAVRHLALPLLASTATTILAFSPILLLPGSAGDFVGTIGESVIWALAASYLLSMTVVAALAGRMLRRRSVAVRRGSAVDRVVGRGLLGAQRRPLIAVVVALFLPIAGFLSARTLGSEFFPPVDRDLFELRLWLGDAAALATTVELTEVIDRELLAHDGVERVDWRIGGSFPSVFYNLVEGQDGASNAAHAIVSTRDPSATKALLGPLQERLDARFPQARIVLRQFAQGPALDADVELRITGPDLGTLRTLGERARLTLQQHPDVLHTRSSLTSGVPKLWIDADEDAARLAGLTLGDVAGQVGGRLEGTVGGSVLEGLARLPVRVQVASDVRADRAALAALPLVAAGGERLPLEAVARFELEPQLGAITRLDRERVNTLGGFTRPGALPIDVASNVVENLEQEGFALPSGYRLELGGAVEQDATAKGNLALYAPLLGTLTVAILVLTFRSVALAALLLVVAGLSVGPGLIGTRLLGLPISFNTILGTLGLVGLAFNNSIVVLASIRSDAAARRGDLERIAQRAAASTRHIVATTLTTIGGFLPLLLFVGGDFWPSLAIVMAGGVAGSAILALLFVPVVYGHVVARLERTPLRQEKRLALATTALIALLGGCTTVGPEHHAPTIDVGKAFAADPAAAAPASSIDLAWWRVFDDPFLDAWIARAVDGNLDLATARARVREARAARAVAQAAARPQLGTGLAAGRAELSEEAPGAAQELASRGLADLAADRVDAGFDAAWELDVFGGVQRSVEAADARLGAAEETRRGVLLQVVAEVAREVQELRGAVRRLRAVERTVAADRATLERLEAKAAAGLAGRLEVERARARLASARARSSEPRAARAAAAHRLAVLVGEAPSAVEGELASLAPRPLADELVPAGLPSELLLRRPDLRAAERQLAAASAEIGVAVARRFPRVTLGGAGGWAGRGFGDLFAAASGTWNLGVAVSWPIFQGGRLRAGVHAAEARHAAAEAAYRLAVLRALEDVETSLVAYGESQVARRERRTAAHAAEHAARLARRLYADGLADFETLFAAEREAAEAQEGLATVETTVGVRLVGLYKALGGGWQVFEPLASASAPGSAGAELMAD